jgi:hypothetical protein
MAMGYYKDGVLQDLNLANKQLRFFARFLTVSGFEPTRNGLSVGESAQIVSFRLQEDFSGNQTFS